MNSIYSLRKQGYKVRVMHRRNFVIPESRQLLNPHIIKQYGAILCRPILMPKGGETVIQLRSPEGIEVEGVATCSIQDSFNRKYGNTKALARALAALDKEKNWIIPDSGIKKLVKNL